MSADKVEDPQLCDKVELPQNDKALQSYYSIKAVREVYRQPAPYKAKFAHYLFDINYFKLILKLIQLN